jgi:hypothetical protein
VKPSGAIQPSYTYEPFGMTLRRALPWNVGSTWAPTLANPSARTPTVGAILGRWGTVVAAGWLAWDLLNIGECTYKCRNGDCGGNSGGGGSSASF